MATPLASYPTQPSSPPQRPINLGDQPHLYVDGYPKLSFFFSQNSRYLHLRRFSALAVRLLLYRQHELTVLENTLLELEGRDDSSNDQARKLFRADFGRLKTDPTVRNGQGPEQHEVYESLKLELKEYEEAVIRFDQLGAKGFDAAELRTVQQFLDDTGSFLPLIGVDATIWGSTASPQAHASDIIQVVHRPSPSMMAIFFRNKVLSWAPHIPAWLWLLLFWSRKRRDQLGHYEFSNRAFEVVALSLGNIATSLFIYVAVTSLYFTAGRLASVAIVVVIATVITLCSALYRNHQFISMLATVCAVLVTLLLKDAAQTPEPSIALS